MYKRSCINFNMPNTTATSDMLGSLKRGKNIGVIHLDRALTLA